MRLSTRLDSRVTVGRSRPELRRSRQSGRPVAAAVTLPTPTEDGHLADTACLRRCHASIKSRQRPPTGDERQNKRKSGPSRLTASKRVSSPPVGTISSASDVTDEPNQNSKPRCASAAGCGHPPLSRAGGREAARGWSCHRGARYFRHASLADAGRRLRRWRPRSARGDGAPLLAEACRRGGLAGRPRRVFQPHSGRDLVAGAAPWAPLHHDISGRLG